MSEQQVSEEKEDLYYLSETQSDRLVYWLLTSYSTGISQVTSNMKML